MSKSLSGTKKRGPGDKRLKNTPFENLASLLRLPKQNTDLDVGDERQLAEDGYCKRVLDAINIDHKDLDATVEAHHEEILNLEDSDPKNLKSPQLAEKINFLLNSFAYHKNRDNANNLSLLEEGIDELLSVATDGNIAWHEFRDIVIESSSNKVSMDFEACKLLFDLADIYPNTDSVKKETPLFSKSKVAGGNQINMSGVRSLVYKYGNGMCSSARFVFQILDRFGKIPADKKDQIKRFVSFVDIVSAFGLQAGRLTSQYTEKTIFGLHKKLPIKFIFNYFQNPGNTGFEYLSDDYLQKKSVKVYDVPSKKYIEKTLGSLSREKRANIEEGQKAISDAESHGNFVFRDGNLFVVNIGERLASGLDPYIKYSYGLIKLSSDGKFFVYSPNKLPNPFYGFELENDHILETYIKSRKDLEAILSGFDDSFRKSSLRNYEAGLQEGTFESLLMVSEQLDQRLHKNDPKPPKIEISFVPLDKDGPVVLEIDPNEYSVIMGSNPQLLSDVLASWDTIETRRLEQQRRDKENNPSALAISNSYSNLPDLTIESLYPGIEAQSDYEGVVQNTGGSMVFVTLNRSDTLRGVLYKRDFTDESIFKSIKKGDRLSIKVVSIDQPESEGKPFKITLKLNQILSKDLTKATMVA